MGTPLVEAVSEWLTREADRDPGMDRGEATSRSAAEFPTRPEDPPT